MLEFNIYTSAHSSHSLSSEVVFLNSAVETTPPVEGVIISGLYMVRQSLSLVIHANDCFLDGSQVGRHEEIISAH